MSPSDIMNLDTDVFCFRIGSNNRSLPLLRKIVRIFHEIRSSFATRIQQKAASQGPTVAGVRMLFLQVLLRSPALSKRLLDRLSLLHDPLEKAGVARRNLYQCEAEKWESIPSSFPLSWSLHHESQTGSYSGIISHVAGLPTVE